MNRFLNILLGLVLLGFLPVIGWAQNAIAPQIRVVEEDQSDLIVEAPWLYSVDGELQLGFGGGPIGLMLQTDRIWRTRGRLSIYSSVSLSAFRGTESYENAPVTITGSSSDLHLRFHTGGKLTFLRSKNNTSKHAYLRLDLYGGLMYFRTNGNYANTDLGVDRPYVVNELTADWGTRFTAGYFFTSNWAAQLSFTNSWRQAAFGLGVPSGLLAGEVDGKAIFGLGVKYRLPYR